MINFLNQARISGLFLLKYARKVITLKYKLLALDMDGTVLNSQKKISPRTKSAINNLIQRGIHVVIGTGRDLAEVRDYRNDFSGMKYAILMSGGLIFDFLNDKPIKIHGLDEKTIFELIDFGLEERAMIHMHTVRDSIAREIDIQNMAAFGMGVYQEMFDRVCVRCDDYKDFVRTHPGEVVKVNLYHRNKQSRDKNFARIQPLNLSISFAEAFNLEMLPADITKGSGLRELCDFLKIDISETVAIGDAPNDKEILEMAGVGVAMGNATDEIKKIAAFITLDNDNDGVAVAIDKFFKE